jgi:hypothetical protein
MQVEVRLRVPNMKARALDEKGYPIDHSTVRFRKRIDVPAMPKPKDTLELMTHSGLAIPAVVVRTDWQEGQGLIISCQYAGRTIPPDDYRALADDPEWELKHLLE